ncbi:hypothetical protein SLE2022_152750 [Rubroshorea leprosula]
MESKLKRADSMPHRLQMILMVVLLLLIQDLCCNCRVAGPEDAFHYGMCSGSMTECNEEDEMLMESEISRRFLQQQKYISYGALKRDQAVCNKQPYRGNCIPGPSNTYNRGCKAIYGCRH